MRTNLSIDEIVRKAEKSVFLLSSDSGIGSGFVVSSEGHLLTCNYVVEAETIEVRSSSGKSWTVPVLARDRIHNLAILKIDDLNAPCMVFTDPLSINTGQKVYALGYPLGLGFTISTGIISNRDCELYGTSFIQTDVALNPGNSGGPVINEKGEVIGMANMSIEASIAQGVSFVTTIGHIFAFAAQLKIDLKRVNEFNMVSNPEQND